MNFKEALTEMIKGKKVWHPESFERVKNKPGADKCLYFTFSLSRGRIVRNYIDAPWTNDEIMDFEQDGWEIYEPPKRKILRSFKAYADIANISNICTGSIVLIHTSKDDEWLGRVTVSYEVDEE